MFTGIVQNQGIVQNIKRSGRQIHFVFRWSHPEKKVSLGESIAVNGVCLTVARLSARTFEVDVIRETLEATNLRDLAIGGKVNLERSLKWGDAMGGHFVSGHVDATGVLKKISRQGKNVSFQIAFPQVLTPFIVRKGSVAIDGVSLTVQSVSGRVLIVGLVPHTLRETNLGVKKIGDRLNLEADLLFRYLLKFKNRKNISLKELLPASKKQNLSWTVQGLKRQGF